MKVNAILNNYQYGSYAYKALSQKIIEDEVTDNKHHKVTWEVNNADLLLLIRVLGNKTLMTESGQYVFKCSICDKISIGYGNNPAPVKQFGFCCDDCNTKFVIPARLAAYAKSNEVK